MPVTDRVRLRHDRRRRRPTRGRATGERGGAMVEFAIMATVLLTLAFGTFEMGMGWSDGQLVTQASRSGARSVTQLGVNTAADSFAVESIEAALGDLADDVDRIVIYDAAAADGSMPPACQAAAPPGVAGLCSVYDGTDFGTYASWVDGSWPPADRNNTLSSGDYVGVTIEVERPYITGFLGTSTFNISDTTVMRVEPYAGD